MTEAQAALSMGLIEGKETTKTTLYPPRMYKSICLGRQRISDAALVSLRDHRHICKHGAELYSNLHLPTPSLEEGQLHKSAASDVGNKSCGSAVVDDSFSSDQISQDARVVGVIPNEQPTSKE